MKQWFCIFLIIMVASCQKPAPKQPDVKHLEPAAMALMKQGLNDLHAYTMLSELTTKAPKRLSGSAMADSAVAWGERTMKNIGFENVRLEPVMVPHWVRGPVEEAFITSTAPSQKLNICALGGSIATPKEGIESEIIEVKSLQEVRTLGDKVKGKIVFYNRPFDKTLFAPFEAYGGAVDQRGYGAVEAARFGAAAVLVRSMTNRIDTYPHTGAMRYNDSIPKIPAAAISTLDANNLSAMLTKGQPVKVRMKLTCETLADKLSYNVIGEIRGTEKPEEVIVIGGHLDSWDKGTGAHDDGAGIVHSIEALRLMKATGLLPKRTVRVVLFMNEENGVRGGKGYAAVERPNEKHIAALESDGGGHAPRGFGVEADSVKLPRITRFESLLKIIDADRVGPGHGGTDIEPLGKTGVPCIGLHPDPQRYFDYHHSDHDTIDKVHDRELELGAIAMAILTYAIAFEGI